MDLVRHIATQSVPKDQEMRNRIKIISKYKLKGDKFLKIPNKIFSANTTKKGKKHAQL